MFLKFENWDKKSIRLENQDYRSDRDAKYYGKFTKSCQTMRPVAKFLHECGIVPQYAWDNRANGVAKRPNASLKDMERSMLRKSTLPNALLGTLKVVVHILNKVLVLKTSKEFWTGTKPSRRHLRIWGCPMKARIYNLYKQKTDPRILSFYFIGYPEESKDFRLLS